MLASFPHRSITYRNIYGNGVNGMIMTDPSSTSMECMQTEIETIIDADSHTIESLEQIVPYIDSRHGGLLSVLEGSQEPLAEIFSVKLASAPPETIDGYSPYFGEDPGLERKLDQMDELGINRAIVHPTLFNTITDVHNSRFAVALANAYNSWREDVFHAHTDRIRSPILITPQRPEKAVEEIKLRAGNEGFVAVGMPASLAPPAGHAMYTPIYETATEYGLPIVLHTGLNEAFRTQYSWNHNWSEDNTISHPFALMWDLTTLVFRGIFDQIPSLEFVCSEAGIMWIPYLMGRLDEHYRHSADELPIDRLPSKYIREHVNFTTHPLCAESMNQAFVEAAIEQIGANSLCFSANLPHKHHGAPNDLVNHLSSVCDESEIRSVMGENANQIFNL